MPVAIAGPHELQGYCDSVIDAHFLANGDIKLILHQLITNVPGEVFIAIHRRDGLREATVIAATVFSVGATIVHVMDILATGNLAPGNTLQNVSNLLKPALLIIFLVAMRRAEAQLDSEVSSPAFENWRTALLQVTEPITIIVATAFGLGFALGQALLVTLIGVLISFVILWVALRRSPEHELGWG